MLFATRHEVWADPIGGGDWTLNDDWGVKDHLRWERNVRIKEQLQKGLNVCYRSSDSMWPTVKSGDLCVFAPFPAAASAEDIQVGDIVFCEVQPGNRFCTHFVLRKDCDVNRGEWCCTIGNKDGRPDGHENGWAYMATIYGRLEYAGA